MYLLGLVIATYTGLFSYIITNKELKELINERLFRREKEFRVSEITYLAITCMAIIFWPITAIGCICVGTKKVFDLLKDDFKKLRGS